MKKAIKIPLLGILKILLGKIEIVLYQKYIFIIEIFYVSVETLEISLSV